MRKIKLINSLFYNSIYNYLVFVGMVFIMVTLIGCKSGTALRHYKKVAAETQLPLTPEKKNALATVCGREFSIEQKTSTKDSVVTKYIRVIDNALVNKLKKQIELLKTNQPNLNIDSLYTSFYDSVLNDIPPCQEIIKWRTETKTVKDTIGNYFAAQERQQLQDSLNAIKARLVTANENNTNLKAKVLEETSDKNYWKIRFFALLSIVILGSIGYGYYKLKKSYKSIPL